MPNGKAPPDPSNWPALQVDEDMRFQSRFWSAQRVGWILMALVTIAALLGLFSVGPLSSTTVRDPQGLVSIEHERVQRLKAPDDFRVSLAKPPGPGDTASLRVSRSLIDALAIENIQPEPEQTAVAADALVFTFRMETPDRPGPVSLSIKPQKLGTVRGEIGLAGQDPARVTLFVLP